MEKFLKWGNDLSDIQEDIDDCQRDDIRERAKSYFADKKDAYSDIFDELVERGRMALEDEETKEALKIILMVVIAVLLLIIAFNSIKRRFS